MNEPEIDASPAEEPPVDDSRERDTDLSAPSTPPETRSQRFFRLAIRWIAGFLVVFALGVLAAVWLIYRPAAQQLSLIQTELGVANQRIAELEAEVARLTPLDTRNQALQEELAEADLHIKILRALSDVNTARLSLANEDIPGARAQLTNTPRTLKELEQSIGANQKGMVGAMLNRLELALAEVERDAFAAESDLNVLATNLVQLENIIFSGR
jgi:hypothetical protein